MSKIKHIFIKNTNNRYSAGSDGRIYSHVKAKTNAKKKIPFPLSLNISTNGYYVVSIVYNDKKKTESIHTLICSAFNGKKPKGKQLVRHYDGDKLNNIPSNLIWGTYFENEADKRRHGRTAIGEKQGNSKLTDEAVKILRKAIPLGLWNETDAGKLFGMSPDSINDIVRGRNWKHIK